MWRAIPVRSFVRAIISLGNSINTPLIAEGVETAGQLQILEGGCDEMQGFLFGEPVDKTPARSALNRPPSAGGRKVITDAQALPARKVQQRGAQGDLEHLTMGQPGVAPEGHPQAVVRQLLLGLTQNRRKPRARTALRGFAIPPADTAISRRKPRHRCFAVFKRRLECLAERRLVE